MPKKVKFNADDEEKIIDFIKSNEILYNVRHKKFRDTESKNRLWLTLASDLGMEVEAVKKKWVTMRDYFVRTKEKKTTRSAASTTSKRDESLSFLLQTSTLKGATVSSLPSSITQSDTQSLIDEDVLITKKTEPVSDNMSNADATSFAGSNSESYLSRDGSPAPFSETPVSKKRKALQMETNGILHEFSAQRPKPSDFMPQKPADDIQQFFDLMASTVRKFSPLSIARLKLKIAQIIGEEEIAWATTRLKTYKCKSYTG